MKQFEYVVTDEVGIHARPAGELVKAAKQYQSKITIEANGKTAEATKLLGIMSLCAKKGCELNITVEGADEDMAFEGIKTFFEENL